MSGVLEGIFWLVLTIGLYWLAREFQRRLNGHPAASPVLIAAAILIGLLLLGGRSYEAYRPAGSVLLWFLGPGTVALAVPLYLNFAQVRSALLPLTVALVLGSATAAGSAVMIAWALGATPEIVSTLAPKSVTTPIAMAVASEIGGIPALAAALVILTGGIGAVCGSAVFNVLGVRDPRARGFAMGTAAHGMGTARAFQVSFVAGTFSGVAMTLNAILTAIALPLIWLFFK
ncbi:MAG: LrgB family protein [Parvibaculaceae bacterium]|nr:LrgB family protein [Parvibaculaceae bacterium]